MSGGAASASASASAASAGAADDEQRGLLDERGQPLSHEPGDLEAHVRRALATSSPYLVAYAVVLSVVGAAWVGAYAWSFRLWHVYSDAPCDEPLARWLVVNASLGLITWLMVIAAFVVLWVSLRGLAYDAHGNDEAAVRKHLPSFFVIVCFACIILCLALVLIAWKIYGSAKVYGMNRARHTCPSEVYDTAFYLIIAEWCVIAVGLVVQLTVLFAPPCGGASAAPNKQP